jgi:hypothetical protein
MGSKTTWKEALLYAIIVALLLEFAANLLAGKSLWQRIHQLEHRVDSLEHPQPADQ